MGKGRPSIFMAMGETNVSGNNKKSPWSLEIKMDLSPFLFRFLESIHSFFSSPISRERVFSSFHFIRLRKTTLAAAPDKKRGMTFHHFSGKIESA
jgi:hypothetical protein